MPDQFEFYTSKVVLQPTPPAPVARETATSVLGKALSGIGSEGIQRQVKVGKEIGLEKVSQAGDIAGSQLGFVPRVAKSEEDIAFNRSAMRAQKMAIQNDIRNTTLGFRDDALRNSNLNSVNSYNARVKNYAQTLLPQVSEALKPYTKNMIEYYGLSHKEPVVKEVDMLNRNIVNSNVQLSFNNNLREATQAAFKGDQSAAISFGVDTKKNLDSALSSGNISSSYHTHALETFNKNVKFARYEGKFNNAIINNKANEELTNFENTNQKDLVPNEKQHLISRFNSMLLQHKQALFAQYGNIENKIKDLNTAIYLNGTNPAVENRIAKMKGIVDQYYSTTPDKAKQLKDSMDFASQHHDFRQSILYAPDSVIRSKIGEKEQELKKGNPTFEKARDLNTLTSDARGVIAQRKGNLYNIVAQNPAVIAATTAQRNSNQANVDLNTGDKLGPATTSSIQDRDETMIQVEKHMGIQPADYEIVPPQDIQKLSSLIASEDVAESLKQFLKIRDQHVNHQNEAINQLQKKIPGANIMFFNGALNPETAPRRDYMMNAMTAKTSELENTLGKTDTTGMKDTVRDDLMSNYGDAILNKNGDPTKILNESLDYAYKLAMTYKLNGIGNPERTAVEDALKAHAKIDTYNGRKYLIPNNALLNTNEVNNATHTLILTMDPKTLRVPTSFRPGEDTKIRQENYRNFLVTDAYPALMENNTGMILLDGARQPVKIMDGSPNGRSIGFTFKELLDKSNELHKSIHKVQAEELARLKRTGVKVAHLIPGFLSFL
ncbi:MAG: hypothetical protein V3V84_00740 [Candidatus Bathyarchaeia archaeon]